MSKERLLRVDKVLSQRQPDLTVILDGVHKPHNVAAIVRSCEAVGVMKVHRIKPREGLSTPHATSGGSQKWVQQQVYPDATEALGQLRQQGFHILAANLSPRAVDYRRIDYTRPTAILVGAELFGVSDTSLTLADAEIFIPMMGMVESFNVSVACAILLAEAQRQRLEAGHYDRPKLSVAEMARYRFEWLHPRLAEICRRQGKPYPRLDEDGDVIS